MIRSVRRLLGRAAPPSRLSSLEAYAKWAAAYPPQAHNALMQAEQNGMLDLLPDVRGRRVLDLAAGSGRYGLLLEQRGAQVIGADNSMAMLRVNPTQRRVLARMQMIPLAGESVIGVVCGLAVGHTPDLQAVIAEIGRVLAPDGWALISDFHPFHALNGSQRTFSSGDQVYAVEHYAHLYADMFAAVRKAGLIIDAVREPLLNGAPAVLVYRLVHQRRD